MKMKMAMVIGSACLALVGCTAQNGEQPENNGVVEDIQDNQNEAAEANGEVGPENFIRVTDSNVIASELDIPWAITKQNDTFFITERTGTIAKIEDGVVTRQELELTKEVLHYGEGGLLGFVLDPNFGQNAKAYVYHTYGDEDNVLNRVVGVELQENKWVETRTIVDQIKGDRFHNGGRIMIGPDDHLYITTGDALNEGLSQKTDELAGKILRIKLDGSVPEDNPFPDSLVYSYGHRNPQGLAWSDDGILYSSEHGPTAHDEINHIERGKNYGWPEIIGDEKATGMEAPLFHSGDETWAPSGMVYLDGKLYVAGLRGNMVIGFDPQKKASEVIWEESGRVRDIFLDGEKLYIITNNTDGRGMPVAADDQLIELIVK